MFLIRILSGKHHFTMIREGDYFTCACVSILNISVAREELKAVISI